MLGVVRQCLSQKHPEGEIHDVATSYPVTPLGSFSHQNRTMFCDNSSNMPPAFLEPAIQARFVEGVAAE